jgi:hypothetical protein
MNIFRFLLCYAEDGINQSKTKDQHTATSVVTTYLMTCASSPNGSRKFESFIEAKDCSARKEWETLRETSNLTFLLLQTDRTVK